MKKINIQPSTLANIVFTLIEYICILFASAFALEEIPSIFDFISIISFIIAAIAMNIIKSKIIYMEHEDEIRNKLSINI